MSPLSTETNEAVLYYLVNPPKNILHSMSTQLMETKKILLHCNETLDQLLEQFEFIQTFSTVNLRVPENEYVWDLASNTVYRLL